MATDAGGLIATLWLIFTTLAMVGSAYLAFAAFLLWKVSRMNPPVLRFAPGVTILKPLCGVEPDLEENLASFCMQAYPGPVQVVLGVSTAADPAAAVARRLIATFPDVDIDLVVGTQTHGANRKVSN